MDSLPNLAIVLVTYMRTPEALRTIIGIGRNLEYPRDKRAWFINDDGSPPEHTWAITTMLRGMDEDIKHISTERFGGGTFNCGKGWNLALGMAHQYSDFVLFLEDDWELREPFRVEPYIELLNDREDVGMVTFRGISANQTLLSTEYHGTHYLEYAQRRFDCYSGNPNIRHARFTKHYGYFAENVNPGEIELDMISRIIRYPAGPKIWRPVSVNEWGQFGHIGRVKTFS